MDLTHVFGRQITRAVLGVGDLSPHKPIEQVFCGLALSDSLVEELSLWHQDHDVELDVGRTNLLHHVHARLHIFYGFVWMTKDNEEDKSYENHLARIVNAYHFPQIEEQVQDTMKEK